MPFEILQVTAAYSNAVLVAILPHISDFAAKLDLPIPQPVGIAQVRHFGCSPRDDHVGGRVFLTNDYSFTFDKGQVTLYCSPKSYYSLDDPDRIPEFYGPIKIKSGEAIKVARNALKKLGYSESELHFDLPPKIKGPVKNEGHYVARYLIEWRDPDAPDTGKYGIQPIIAGVEVDATTGGIQMFHVSAHYASRPDPKISIHPPVLVPAPKSQPVGGGTRLHHVGKKFEQAFLAAILPQVSDFIKRAGIDIKIPVTTNDVDMPHYECWWDNTRTIIVVLYLKTGDRFWYEHGQVISFQTRDAYYWSAPNSPGEDKPPEQFFGQVNLSAEEALVIVRKAINQLGWPDQFSLLKKKPEIVPPRKDGTNYFARYFFNWWREGEGAPAAEAEVDASTQKLKSLNMNDRANPQIWREPPKVDVPMEVEVFTNSESPPLAPSRVPIPVPTLPPSMPLPGH